MGARETLRVTEQQVLLDAATAYMNLLRDQAILDLNRRNVEVLTEQLKQTRDRGGVPPGCITSRVNYRRVIGVNPGRLDPGTPVDRLSPSPVSRAITAGETMSPSVLASMSPSLR